MRDHGTLTSSLRSDGRFLGHELENAGIEGWYDLGFEALRTATATESLRSWPHHVPGRSPGDTYHAEPYFHVTPPAGELAGGGCWLTASTIVEAGDPIAFLKSAS